MSSIDLRESSATLAKNGTRWKAVLITPGQGSSGIYSESMLKQYGSAAFPKGTHSYVDHPAEGEQRSPKNLFGVLAETAHYEEGVGLVGEIEVLPHWAEFAEAVAPHVGLSIFATGTSSKDENGNTVIESLDYSRMNSVDLVSYAGRGGSLAERLYESAIAATEPKVTTEEISANPAENSGTAIAESRTTTKENTVEITELGEKVDKIAEGLAALTAVLTPLAESLAAAEPVVEEEKVEIDFARVAEAAIDAGLPAAARKAVYEKVRLSGAKVEDVIAEQKALVDDMRKQVAEAAGLNAVRIGAESANQDWTVARWKGKN